MFRMVQLLRSRTKLTFFSGLHPQKVHNADLVINFVYFNEEISIFDVTQEPWSKPGHS